MIQIDQKPKYQLLPVGQNVIFTISDPIVTANETKKGVFTCRIIDPKPKNQNSTQGKWNNYCLFLC